MSTISSAILLLLPIAAVISLNFAFPKTTDQEQAIINAPSPLIPSTPFHSQLNTAPTRATQAPVKPSASPPASTPPSPLPAKPPPEISFSSLPSNIPTGQKFEIAWEILGPPGAKGTNAQLVIEFDSSESSPGSSSSSKGRTSQSFGNFTIPAKFKSAHSYNTPDKTLTVTASAVIQGKTISKKEIITLK